MDPTLADVTYEFRRHQALAERALESLSEEAFFRRPSDVVNSPALIVKHLAGNLQSRWGNVLGGDGDSPTRNRDQEFVLEPADTREALMARWTASWQMLLATLSQLETIDLDRTITIRGEPHTLRQALLRGVTHAAYHVGQILYLARWLEPHGEWLTIAPGKSREHRPSYRRGA